MSPWEKALCEGAVTGSVASFASALALVAAGRRENGDGAAPMNAVSHWVWGDAAFREGGPSWRNTLTGYLVHHSASIFWGTLHARAWGMRADAKRPLPALAGGAAASAIACFVDYRLTPHRFTPGFEHRLSTRSMLLVYTCFGLGLAAGSMALTRKRSKDAGLTPR
jgi:hypothetical protein